MVRHGSAWSARPGRRIGRRSAERGHRICLCKAEAHRVSHDDDMTDDNHPPPRPPDPGQVIAAIQEHMSRLPKPEWPVFGLTDADQIGWLAGAGEDRSGVRAIRIDYRPPGGRERLVVQTQPDGPSPPNLDRVLDRLDAEEDEGEPFELLDDPAHPTSAAASSPAEVTIEDEIVPAVQRHRGASTACWLRTQGVTILLAARHASLNAAVLHQIHDLKPLKRRRAQLIEQFLRDRPYPPPPYGP